jgi:hypothetical protein
MAITQAMCTSFKVELLSGGHNFNTTNVARTVDTQDTFKIALFTSSATLGATTTAYSTSDEATGTGYSAGGNTLTVSAVPTSTGTTAFLDFTDTTWSTATVTARGALIYNSTYSDTSVAVLDFGADKTSTAGDFTIIFPTADSTSAIIRIA